MTWIVEKIKKLVTKETSVRKETAEKLVINHDCKGIILSPSLHRVSPDQEKPFFCSGAYAYCRYSNYALFYLGIIKSQHAENDKALSYARQALKAMQDINDKKGTATLFPEYFILYKPKAIVSGDFYWVGKKENEIICAVADCTGHGVPGAFMSLLGHNILENVISKEAVTDPGTILTTLNQEIVARFSKDQESAKHGMDIAIISINYSTQKFQYAGAKNSVYHVRENVLQEIKADKFSTGTVMKDHSFLNYTNHSHLLQTGDMIYLFSDGFPDQKGGADKKKLFYQPFKDLLLSISMLPVQKQKIRLDEFITNWIGTGEQMDDILVTGIRYV